MFKVFVFQKSFDRFFFFQIGNLVKTQFIFSVGFGLNNISPKWPCEITELPITGMQTSTSYYLNTLQLLHGLQIEEHSGAVSKAHFYTECKQYSGIKFFLSSKLNLHSHACHVRPWARSGNPPPLVGIFKTYTIRKLGIGSFRFCLLENSKVI